MLGIQITRRRKNGKLCVEQEVCSTVAKWKIARTPLDENPKLTKTMCPQNEKEFQEMRLIPYQQAVGSLLFTAHITRLDV